MGRVFRWKAIVPVVLVFGMLVAGWLLYLDELVRRNVEAVGRDIVGARVDLAEADVNLSEGFVALRGLAVTNPDAPMKNLFEADEIVADLRMVPLLQKKVFIDTLAVRGVRFGTDRETSGAIDQPSEASRELRRQIDGWANRIRIPEFSLDGLAGAVNLAALRAESLQTPQVALGLVAQVDSSRRAWEGRLRTLNPQPVIDSARALVNRLSTASIPRLGVQGVVQSVQAARATVDQVERMRLRVDSLEGDVRNGVMGARQGLEALAASRARDIAYARGLLRIPSLDTPDISPSILGSFAVTRVQPILYWLGVADRYLPPGLNPSRRPGPKRLRWSGEDVSFPARGSLPKFTLSYGEVSLSIGGGGVASGEYQATVRGLTTTPALLGSPLELHASRVSDAGPSVVSLDAMFNHVASPATDSIRFALVGVSLPTVSLPGLDADLALGRGSTELSLRKHADSIAGRMVWRSPSVEWTRHAASGTGVAGRLEDFIWRVVSGVRDVEIEVSVAGHVRGPGLGIRSNIGAALSASLRRQLSDEIAAAETRVRAEVNRLVEARVGEFQSRVSALESEVQRTVSMHREALAQVKADLEARIVELRRMVPGGIIPPQQARQPSAY